MISSAINTMMILKQSGPCLSLMRPHQGVPNHAITQNRVEKWSFNEITQEKSRNQEDLWGPHLYNFWSSFPGSTADHRGPPTFRHAAWISDHIFQVQLRIIEARQLSGMQLDPVCTVTIGNQKKHTSVKEQTNTPFWDEFFVFDFKMAAQVNVFFMIRNRFKRN